MGPGGKDSPIAKVTTPKRLFEGEVKVLDIGHFEAIWGLNPTESVNWTDS